MAKLSEKIEQDIIAFYLKPSSMNDTVKRFGISNRYQLKKILQKNGIPEHAAETKKALQKNNAEKTCLERYGVSCTFKSNDAKLNGKAGMLEKYGVEYPYQNEKLLNKMKYTKRVKYGDANYNNSQQAAKTCFEKYGRENVGRFGSPEHDKAMLLKYGTKHCMQIDSILKKAENTCLSRYGVRHPIENPNIMEKQKQTMLSRYSISGMLQKPEYLAKAKAGIVRKYGMANVSSLPEIKKKISDTWRSKTTDEIIAMRKKAS